MEVKSINCIVNAEYESLYKDFFLPSCDDTSLIIPHYLKWKRTNCNWGNFEFKNLMLLKVEKIIKSIKNNKGNNIIWTDVDLFFCQPIPIIFKELNKKLIKNNLVITREYRNANINSGFFAIKCNKKTLNFFKLILSNMKQSNTTEQQTINQILPSYSMSWELLPITYWNTTIGFPIPDNVKLIHCNHLPSMKKDMLKLKYCKSYTKSKYHALSALKRSRIPMI